MDISDKLDDLKRKAEDAAVEHKDQIKEAVEKAEAAADKRTEGKYHEQIAKAGTKAEDYVENLRPQDQAGSPPARDE
jgi:DNA-binding protein H-NS